MGIDVIAFGLPILLTSYWRERDWEGGKKPPRKEMGYIVFLNVNNNMIGRPKAVTSIPILLGHFRQLQIIVLKTLKGVIMFNIIMNVHEFFVHCLIP